MENLHARIRMIRKLLNASGEAFATKLGVTKQAISNMETGKSAPSPAVLYKMYKIFDINLNYIIAGEGDMFITEKSNTALKKTLMKEFEQMLKTRGIE